MQQDDDYTTVSKFERDRRDNGVSVDGNWFRDEVAEGRIPSVKMAGKVYVRTSDLQANWERYCAWREARHQARAIVARRGQMTKSDATRAKLDEIDRKLELIMRYLAIK